MTDAVQEQLRAFATGLIEQNGGLVDWPQGAESGQAILSPELARRQGVDEMLQLSLSSDGAGMPVNLASEFLSIADHWLERVPRVAALQLPEAYLKGGDISGAIAKAFTWLNAKVCIEKSEPARIDYHTWWLHVQLASEDRWESQVTITVNAESQVEVDFPDPLQDWELRPETGEVKCASTYEAAVAAARRRLPDLASGFLVRMDGRLARDRKRLTEYYNALLLQSRKKLQRARTAPDPGREDDGGAEQAVKLELRRKLAELMERYAIEATVRPLVMIRSQLPALHVTLDVQRKRAQRRHTIYWNSMTKAFDPIRCTACGRGTYSVAFTNEEVEPLCASCAK